MTILEQGNNSNNYYDYASKNNNDANDYVTITMDTDGYTRLRRAMSLVLITLCNLVCSTELAM